MTDSEMLKLADAIAKAVVKEFNAQAVTYTLRGIDYAMPTPPEPEAPRKRGWPKGKPRGKRGY